MQNLTADVEAPAPQEQVIDGGPESPADHRLNVRDTKDGNFGKGVSALHELLKRMKANDEDAFGEVKRLREMLREPRKAYVNAKGPEGVASLHLAAERGLKKAAEVLIEAGANVSIQDDDLWQPLHYACRGGNRNIATLLLDNGADIEAQDRWQQTPLHKVCKEVHSEVLELLLERGANVNALDDEKYTPLYFAADWGRRSAVELLLRKDKSNINHALRDDDGWTALHAAADHGLEEIVSILRREGAGVGIRDNQGRTALILATDQEQVGAMRELLYKVEEHEDLHLDARDNEQDAALALAAGRGFLAGVRLLIERGADCNIRNSFYRTPIIIASRWRNRDVVLELLQNKRPADINAQDDEGQTALHHAASRGHADVLQLLLKHHADASISDNRGRQALHLACFQGNLAIVKMLWSITAGQQLESRDHDGMTPLHIACKAGDEDVEHVPSEKLGPENLTNLEGEIFDFISGRHDAVVEFLLKSNPDPDAKASNGETVLRLAIQSGKHEKVQHLVEYMQLYDKAAPLCSTLKDFDADKTHSNFYALLYWASGKFEMHPVARSLLMKHYTSSGSALPGSKDWSAIQWAAWANLPDALWLLIANSPLDKQTMVHIKSLDVPNSPVSQSQQQGGKKDHNCDDSDFHLDRLTVPDVIRDPPLGLLCNMHADSQDFGLPTVDKKMYSNPDILSLLEAVVFQFYKGESRFGSIRRDRNVQEVIYTKGPQTITEAMMKRVKDHIQDLEPSFIWVHLPSTNMVWMNDLLQAIMKNEGYNASQFRQVKAFLKASWVQVPDKTSESRIMRPRFAIKDHVPEADDEPSQIGIELESSKTKRDVVRTEEKGRDKKSKSTDRPFDKEKERRDGAPRDEMIREDGTQTAKSTAASAIYMPYLSFSTQCAGTDAKGVKDTDNSSQTSKQENGEQGGEYSELTRLHLEREQHQSVLSDHESQTIHRSSTLDEWYYHFDLSDPESAKDKYERNKSQVVQNYLPNDVKKKSHWPLIRVNQLWGWTLGNKWLITASSYPIDGSKNALIQGILDHLATQREAGGSRSQPDTAAGMSKLIVDYCIESYERRPDAPKGLLSIRQMFSKAINVIGRGETMLFKDFSLLIQRWREQIEGEVGQGRMSKGDKDRELKEKHSAESDSAGVFPGETDNNHKGSGEISADVELRKATQKAQDLSNDIKDIRDELNILKATAQYQQDVQEALYMSQERFPSAGQNGPLMDRIQRLQANLSAAHVVNDIREMDSVADRIQAAVNTTLSLQQSEIANLQATESVKQGREAVKQGKTLMVFTVVTILFLPLSFLSSMFALDVASFQQAPGWVFAVMFSVSVAFFIPLAGYAVYSEKVEGWWNFARDAFRTTNKDTNGASQSTGKNSDNSGKVDHSHIIGNAEDAKNSGVAQLSRPAHSWFFLLTPFDNIPPNATEACSRLATYSPESTLYPNDTEYVSQLEGYWVIQNREFLPSCRFAPRSAEDVSFAIKAIRATQSRFAVTSGRHSVAWGANNAANGVTIDFNAHMRRVGIDEPNSVVHVQPGTKWGDVYEYLESRRWMVVGGRLSDIGVGGLLLGGGISHYGPRKGWGSDNVLAFTVVLASGEIVRASPTSHPDLYWALKGGGNRYGIVVEFELAAFRYENPLFAGAILLDSTNLSEATRRLTVFNDKGSLRDGDATATMPFSWSAANPNRTGLMFLADSYGRNFTNNSSSPLYPLQELASVPVGTSSLAHMNVSTLSVNLFATNNASRYAQTVMTLSNNASVLEAAVDEFESLIQPLLAADPTLVAQAMYQPIPSAMFQHMTDSPIKLTDGPVFVFFLSLVWTNSSKDLRYESSLRQIHQLVEHRVRILGGFRQWKYWNYAAGWQDVYQDYGDDAFSRLFRVADAYDADRLFYWLQANSFDYF